VPLDGSDPVANAKAIEQELSEFSPLFMEIPIWTVLTKIDLVTETSEKEILERLEEAFPDRPRHAISAVTGAGVDLLVDDLMQHVARWRESLALDPALEERDRGFESRLTKDVLDQTLRSTVDERRSEERDPDIEVVYRE